MWARRSPHRDRRAVCGIAGGVWTTADSRRTAEGLREVLTAMADAMRHRGPDDAGVYAAPDGRAGLANRRLAIRDLSPAGHMPMSNPEGTLHLTYNGEIYNAGELRARLEREGYSFLSHSDAEIVLHGYAAWGDSVVEHLRGMFAFGLLDLRAGRERLFVARDRLGIKPLYYAWAGGVFLFASELKGLLASGEVSREWSAEGLAGYLMLGAVPNPHTIYRDVIALPAGCTLSVSLSEPAKKVEPRRYWSLPSAPAREVTHAEAVEKVRALLEDAVRTHLVSDVPLGAFLSGGLDSSAVAALMRRATSGPLRTCSMAFEEAEYNEAPYARVMAQWVRAEHYERVVTAADLAAELDNVMRAMDQPTVDGVNTYFVSQTARQAGLTVALSGIGGDELFGGYPNTFRGVPQMLRAVALAHSVPGGAAIARSGLGLLPGRQWTRIGDALAAPPSPAMAYLARRGIFAPSEVGQILHPDVWEEARNSFDLVEHIAMQSGNHGRPGNFASGGFGWTSRAELGMYTHNQLLRDTDVMGMAHALEVRVPLLDHKLVEAVLTLPASVKLRGNGPKPLLVQAIGDLLPHPIRTRHDKQGFTFPFGRWLRGPLKVQVEDLLHRSKERGVLRAAGIDASWRDYLAGRAHWSRAWLLAVLGNSHV